MCNSALSQSIWIPSQHRSLPRDTAPITMETFRMWDKLSKSRFWQYNSPLMSLTGNNYFPPGKDNKLYLKWTSFDHLRLKDVLKGNTLCSLSELRQKWSSSPWDEWRYRQLQHFVHFLPKPLRSVRGLKGD